MMDDTIYNFHQLNCAKGFKIVHLNIRSLPRKIDQLRLILEGSTIDIMTISETWLHNKIDTQLISIQGYNVHRLDRVTRSIRDTKRGGGLLVYYKTSLDVYVQETESSSTTDLEVQWLKIKRNRCKDIILANVYRPPTGNVGKAIKHLGQGLESLARPADEILIMGDFNVDYQNKKSINFKKLIFFEKANSLEQKISTTTRNTTSSKTLIDIALTNIKHIRSAGALDSFLSDHQPIYILKKKLKDKRKTDQSFEGRSYSHYNRQTFMENVSNADWAPFYECNDPAAAWEKMIRIITEEADRMCPVRDYKIRNSKPPWIVSELIEQMKDRDYFYTKAKRTNNEDDWNIAKFHRNQVNFNIRKAKADFIKEQLNNNEGNSARFWRTIKQIMPHKKGSKSKGKISIKTNEGEVIHENEVANHLNTFFANTGNTNEQTPDPKRSTQTPPETPQYTQTDSNLDGQESVFSLSKFTRVEVEALIRKINTSKSSGTYLISSRLLKDSFLALSDKLTLLFNLSLQTNTFPSQWKKSVVVPIPKTGDPHKKENYRPISLLPLPGKILEKLVHTQLTLFLEDNDLLTESQFGFRKQRSTTHAISQLLNQVYTNINRSVITAAVYVDFSKAFNCVQHPILMDKLGKLNLHHTVLAWITSYLTDREQRTLANNVYSTSQLVQQGVPQGSVLGPLFYVIYSNDIAEIIENSGFVFYADDTVLYSKQKSIHHAEAELQRDLNRLGDWCTANKIYINTEKTKVMFFGSKQKIASLNMPTLSINGESIQRAKTYTYLGIRLDEQLSMETHANSVIQRVSDKIYQLTKIRSFITKRAALLIYKNMILPILEYGDIFLHSATQKVRKKLQTLQNKALRCALGKEKIVSSDLLHTEAHLLKLQTRRHVHILLHMYQLSQLPNFKLWKTHKTTGVKTRSSKKKLITLRRPTNEKYKKSITYQGPKLWNSLPGCLQKLDSYHEFKNQVNKFYGDTLKTPSVKDKHKNRNINKGSEVKGKKGKKGKTKPKALQKTQKPKTKPRQNKNKNKNNNKNNNNNNNNQNQNQNQNKNKT